MADVLSTTSMLSLPGSSSSAFSTYRSSVVDQSLSASPRRKVARLDTDSDSASASRSRPKHAPVDAKGGPVVIHVSGAAARGPKIEELLRPFQGCLLILLEFQPKDRLPLTYERLYAACRSLVLAGKGEDIAHMLERQLDPCTDNLKRVLLDGEVKDIEYLNLLVERLQWFEGQVALLTSALAYLDRVYLTSVRPVQSIRSMAYDRLESKLLNSADFHEKLASAIKGWTASERKDGTSHNIRKKVVPLIRLLQLHGLYQPRFERSYLLETEGHYAKEVKERTGPKGEALQFLDYCLDKIEKEIARAKEVLPEESWEAVRKATERGLLTGHLAWLAKSAMSPLFETKDVNKLRNLHTLYSRRDNLPLLAEEFKNVVQARVKGIISDPAKDDKMVEELLALKSFCDEVVSKALVERSHGLQEKDRQFEYALREAFTVGFKARRVKPAEMIAKHVDWVMRKTKEELQLDAALELYRFTEDRDVFRTFYHRALAKRLLLGKSANDEFEKVVLKKLKEEYDPEFGMGEHMFKDLQLSVDLMKGFEEELVKRDVEENNIARRLKAVVLQPSFWPFPSRENKTTQLPSELQATLESFTTFYAEKHKGRKLDWHHSLGTAVLAAQFDSDTKAKHLSVSLFQAVVLLLFNDKTQISFQEIKESTGMDDAELRRTLQSLALGKKRVLRRERKGPDVKDEDVFEFNAAFKDPRVEIHINSIQSKETPEETKHTELAIESDRRHYLDAAIVRIMKARKQLTYEEIKLGTIEAVRKHFAPDVSAIKQRIDQLVEQEYISRDEKDKNLFYYVA